MPEVFTASFNPDTGERREFRQEVVPPPPPDYGMSSINPVAVQEMFRTQKIEDAEKAVAAAIQFQGLRGYQQALQKGEKASEALARYGPMMFYSRPQSFAPSVKALAPPKVPQITPYQRESLDLQKQRLAKPPVMTPYQQELIRLREQEMQNRRPTLDPAAIADQEIAKAAYKAAVEELETTPRKEPRRIPLIGGQFGGNLDEIAELEKKRDEARAKLQGPALLSERAASQATGPETIRLTKDGKKAIFDSQTRKFLRYATD